MVGWPGTQLSVQNHCLGQDLVPVPVVSERKSTTMGATPPSGLSGTVTRTQETQITFQSPNSRPVPSMATAIHCHWLAGLVARVDESMEEVVVAAPY